MDDELNKLINRIEGIRDLADSFVEITHYPSYGIQRPPGDSRAAILIELFWDIRKFILLEMNRSNKGIQESRDILEYNIQGSRIDKRFYEAGGDDRKAVTVEIEDFRPFVKKIRDFSSLNYAMLAQPIWETGKQSIDTNAVFFSGSKDVEKEIINVCKKLNLYLMPSPIGESIANARWKQLQKSTIAVFDFTYADIHKKADISYELGIVLTLGRPLVIIASEKYALPFDVDIAPVILREDKNNEFEIKLAFDLAMIWLYNPPKENHILKTLDYTIGKYPRRGDNVYINQVLQLLEEQKKRPDPVNIYHGIKRFLDFLKDGSTYIIHPIWPPEYPDECEFSLFHVMPYYPDWAKDAMAAVQETCDNHGIKYIRGDQVEDPNIIRSIWTEIAKASHVLIDITGFSPNVALELGIAHTLGKKSLIVAHPNTEKQLFPMIAKQRVSIYKDNKELKDIIQNFLK
jgi:nucleoside 2-deoxyribosyltransferase